MIITYKYIIRIEERYKNFQKSEYRAHQKPKYNIAQNQSFAQKGVGTNIKPYIYGPTRKILLVLAISTSI